MLKRLKFWPLKFLISMRAIQTALLRKETLGAYDQILLNTSSETNLGTCYYGRQVVFGGSCHKIGIFNPVDGLAEPIWNKEMRAPGSSVTITWVFRYERFYVGSSDVGTSAPDHIIDIRGLNKQICQAINKKINGNSTIPLIISVTASTPEGRYIEIFTETGYAGGNAVSTSTSAGTDIAQYGCVDTGTQYTAFLSLKEL